jgi:PIN domain nuclease of toxin-antitoxin system
MNYLLDTQIFLWWLAADRRLQKSVNELIANPANRIWLSAASAWEMEIKSTLGKLATPGDLERQLAANAIDTLPIHLRHVQRLRDLPFIHADPFDRILVAQSIADELVLITADPVVARYPCRLVTNAVRRR